MGFIKTIYTKAKEYKGQLSEKIAKSIQENALPLLTKVGLSEEIALAGAIVSSVTLCAAGLMGRLVGGVILFVSVGSLPFGLFLPAQLCVGAALLLGSSVLKDAGASAFEYLMTGDQQDSFSAPDAQSKASLQTGLTEKFSPSPVANDSKSPSNDPKFKNTL